MTDENAKLADILERLCRRTIEYVGPKKPSPQMDCDLEMWNLAKDGLTAVKQTRGEK
jgi:hypothetical protein